MGPAKRAGTLADIELYVFGNNAKYEPNLKPRKDKLMIYREERLYMYRCCSPTRGSVPVYWLLNRGQARIGSIYQHQLVKHQAKALAPANPV